MNQTRFIADIKKEQRITIAPFEILPAKPQA
jgi:hypothetical protein